MIVEKKIFKTLVVLMPVAMILFFSINFIFLSGQVLSERKDLTVFQKMLSVLFN